MSIPDQEYQNNFLIKALWNIYSLRKNWDNRFDTHDWYTEHYKFPCASWFYNIKRKDISILIQKGVSFVIYILETFINLNALWTVLNIIDEDKKKIVANKLVSIIETVAKMMAYYDSTSITISEAMKSEISEIKSSMKTLEETYNKCNNLGDSCEIISSTIKNQLLEIFQAKLKDCGQDKCLLLPKEGFATAEKAVAFLTQKCDDIT